MQEVICINDSFHPESKRLIPHRPIKNEIYNIRDATTLPNGVKAVWLEEIVNPELPHPSGLGTYELSFDAKRFTTLLGHPVNIEQNEFIQTNY